MSAARRRIFSFRKTKGRRGGGRIPHHSRSQTRRRSSRWRHSTGRRTALAQWIASPANPLTARVMVNRVWQQHFGRGLCSTTSDFGTLGEKPSHPELLDWLARRFVADGWGFKKLHRLILTSAAWRQGVSSTVAEHARQTDPENRLLWRWNTRRMDAEQIRDAIFAATGELDLTAGGPGADATKPRRAIYTKRPPQRARSPGRRLRRPAEFQYHADARYHHHRHAVPLPRQRPLPDGPRRDHGPPPH